MKKVLAIITATAVATATVVVKRQKIRDTLTSYIEAQNQKIRSAFDPGSFTDHDPYTRDKPQG